MQERISLDETEEGVSTPETVIEDARARHVWSVRHMSKLWQYTVVGFSLSVAVLFASVELYSQTGGVLPLGWGGAVPLVGASGGVAGAALAWWEDMRGV